MDSNTNSRVRSQLRWQLFAAWSLLLVVVVGVIFWTLAVKISSLILGGEVEKLRPAARELRKASEDYFMSPSERQLKTKFAKIMQAFPDLSYVLIEDRYGRPRRRGREQVLDSIEGRIAQIGHTRNDVNVVKAHGETYIDIGEMTGTVPPLPVHAGFARSLTDSRTRSLLRNRGAIALAVLAAGLVAGFLLSAWLTRPLAELSALAERLSLGDTNVRLSLKYRGEIGTVYNSLERLRESVLYALRRLNNRAETTEQQTERKLPDQGTLAGGESTWPNPR